MCTSMLAYLMIPMQVGIRCQTRTEVTMQSKECKVSRGGKIVSLGREYCASQNSSSIFSFSYPGSSVPDLGH